MMPDLGKYATSVLSAYGASIAILVVLIWASLARSARVRKSLEAFEAKRKGNG
ncbi:MAG: heme exporter protein CcmD [Paracoccaceae bacterium]|jgi:heme exporter protein D|nr:heme exporter protein CcmD [Paracoccaceae bacterium]MDP7185427.1 heme exporter protein CcmD [Paracoccaceae bacterium]